MKKRGRPKKNGLQPSWMLARAMYVVYAYQRSRADREKHSVAVQAAIRYVREKAPWMRISATVVKRILAEWRPQDAAYGLSVTQPDPAHAKFILPNGRVVTTLFSGCCLPRIEYPRANGV